MSRNKNKTTSFFHNQVTRTIEPMLARPTREIKKARFPAAVELKYDGIRAIVFVSGGRAAIQTRLGHDYTLRYQSLGHHLGKLSNGTYDGEIFVPAHPGNEFAMMTKHREDCVFIAFDLPDSTESYMQRRVEVVERVDNAPTTRVKYSRLVGFAKNSFKAVQLAQQWIEKGEEGVIVKPLDSLYHKGQRKEWFKIKENDD